MPRNPHPKTCFSNASPLINDKTEVYPFSTSLTKRRPNQAPGALLRKRDDWLNCLRHLVKEPFKPPNSKRRRNLCFTSSGMRVMMTQLMVYVACFQGSSPAVLSSGLHSVESWPMRSSSSGFFMKIHTPQFRFQPPNDLTPNPPPHSPRRCRRVWTNFPAVDFVQG